MSTQVTPGLRVSHHSMGSLLLAEAEVGTEKPDYAEGHKDEAREGGRMEGADKQVYLSLKATQHGLKEGQC